MIPRILVPQGARLSDEDVATSTRRRPSTLDERTLVPATVPIFKLDGKSNIPTNLPLDSIATRVVVPRDVNVEAVQREDESNLPVQPTEMDERMTVPHGAVLPEEMPAHFEVPEGLVEPDIMSTGEVTLLPPEGRDERSLKDRLPTFLSMLANVALVLFLIFEPKIFGPHVLTKEQEEIGRRQMTVLLPPGALDALKPSPPPGPHDPVRVDPRVIKKVAPPIEKPVLAPQPVEQPAPSRKDLPNAPAPQQQPPSLAMPAPKTEAPVQPKLEVPQAPTPTAGLILPKQSLSPGGLIRDAEKAGRANSPMPMGGQMPGGLGGSGGGGRGHGTASAGIEMLTDTEGIDFNDYLRRVYFTVKRNWEAVMPASVQLGDQGVVSLHFKIMKDGSVPDGDPEQIFSSGKEPLDRAAFSSIRASNPFPQLPTGFKAPYIELRFTYYYNLQPPR